MKLQSMLNRQKATCLLMISLFIFMFSCKKTNDGLPKATEESADVVHDWYKLFIRLQLYANPATAPLSLPRRVSAGTRRFTENA